MKRINLLFLLLLLGGTSTYANCFSGMNSRNEEERYKQLAVELIQFYKQDKASVGTHYQGFTRNLDSAKNFISWLCKWESSFADSLDFQLKSGFNTTFFEKIYDQSLPKLWSRFNIYLLNKEKFSIEIEYQQDIRLEEVVNKLDVFFYEIYPLIYERYRKAETEEQPVVKVRFDPELINNPAYASNGQLTFSTNWFLKNPDDIGVLTHETIHLLQKDFKRGVPGWLIEGTADYIRYLYRDIARETFPLPADTKNRSYTNAYRVTARFLDWLEKRSPGFNDYLYQKLFYENYSPELFEQRLGANIDQLWQEYDKENH